MTGTTERTQVPARNRYPRPGGPTWGEIRRVAPNAGRVTPRAETARSPPLGAGGASSKARMILVYASRRERDPSLPARPPRAAFPEDRARRARPAGARGRTARRLDRAAAARVLLTRGRHGDVPWARHGGGGELQSAPRGARGGTGIRRRRRAGGTVRKEPRRRGHR